MNPVTVTVKYTNNTHVARLPTGQSASAASGYEEAAKRVLAKAYPGQVFRLDQEGTAPGQAVIAAHPVPPPEPTAGAESQPGCGTLMHRIRDVLKTARLDLLDSSRPVDYIDELLALIQPRSGA